LIRWLRGQLSRNIRLIVLGQRQDFFSDNAKFYDFNHRKAEDKIGHRALWDSDGK